VYVCVWLTPFALNIISAVLFEGTFCLSSASALFVVAAIGAIAMVAKSIGALTNAKSQVMFHPFHASLSFIVITNEWCSCLDSFFP
jgi:hypothetical protein